MLLESCCYTVQKLRSKEFSLDISVDSIIRGNWNLIRVMPKMRSVRILIPEMAKAELERFAKKWGFPHKNQTIPEKSLRKNRANSSGCTFTL